MINQNGLEWNDQGCYLMGGTTVGGRTACKQLGSGYYSNVHGCSTNQIIIYTTSRCRFQLGWAFFFLSVSFRFSMVWWKVIVACVSATMRKSPLKLQFFTSFLTQNNFFYFSFDATYYIAFHTLVAPNIIFNFLWCCMLLQSFSWVLRLSYHLNAYYRYSCCRSC